MAELIRMTNSKTKGDALVAAASVEHYKSLGWTVAKAADQPAEVAAEKNPGK